MKRNYKRLAIILSIVMLICLFAPYGVVAETTGDSSGDLTVTSGGTNEDGDGLGEGEGGDLDEDGSDLGGEDGGDLGGGEGGGVTGEGDGDIELMAGKKPEVKYDVTVKVDPPEAGSVTGGGKYTAGTSATVKATPKAAAYKFDGWYAAGVLKSEAAEYTFTVTENITLTAVFSTEPGIDEDDLRAGEAIIRDFKSSHNDFQRDLKNYETVKGLVESTLDTDKNPVRSSKKSDSIDSADSFAQWFKNVPGINYGIQYTMLLEKGADGFYYFEDTSFFPIDGMGFGNDGNSNNYHFTLEYETKFNYDPDKRTIKVKSDDDLWIFINGKLVVDLGGIHKAGEYQEFTVPVECFEGKKSGDACTFKLFFAERRTDYSVLAFGADFLAPYEEPKTWTLTTNTSGEGSGTVTPAPANPYADNDTVELTATPDDDSIFVEWQGYDDVVDVVNGNTITVTMNSDKTITAVFALKEVDPEPVCSVDIEKTVNKQNAYAGENVRYTIAVTNTGDKTLRDVIVYDDLADKSWVLYDNLDPLSSFVINIDYTILTDKQVNDVITNTATVYANEYYPQAYRLSAEDSESELYWEFDGNIAESEYGLDFGLTETASANVTVIARQRDRERSSVTTYTLRTAVEGEGTVSPGPGTSQYSSGSTVQLSAVPAEGWKFDGWKGDTVDDNNQIIMNGNKSVTAVFSKIEEELEDEPTPQAPATEPQDSVIEEEEISAAPVDELPKTGGVPAGVFYGIGGLLAAAGAVLMKKIKK